MLLDRTPNDEQIRQRAAEYADELRSAEFEVVLIPASERKHSGHKLRALQFANPEWYSRFAGQYTNCRGIGRKRMKRPRTYILKSQTITALDRLAAGNSRGVMAERLVNFIRAELSNEQRKPRSIDEMLADYVAGIPF